MMFDLLIFIILLLCTGFFVATEFAIVKVRSSKIEELIVQGKSGSKSAKHVTSHLDEYLSACQLGITVTALGIGMIGERTFEHLLIPVFNFLNIPLEWSSALLIIFAFILATYLHVVVGELAPKTMALQQAERITLLFSKPIIIFYKIMYPFIWLLNGSARLLTRFLGFEFVGENIDLKHSEAELRILLRESDEIEAKELEFVNNILDLDKKLCKDLMVHRNDIVLVEKGIKLEDLMELVETENYTRYPVFENDKDNIIGYINVKELMVSYYREKGNLNINSLINPTLHIIDSLSIISALEKLQRERSQLVILMDEYGGVSGLLTMEDILEELIGDIRDEFDLEEDDEICVRTIEGKKIYEVSGKVNLSDIEKLLCMKFINKEEVTTIGGIFLLKEIDSFEMDGYIFSIKEKEDMSIKKVLITKKKEIKKI